MKANPCSRMMACAVIVGIMAVVLIGCPDFLKDDPTVTGVTVSPDTASVVTGGTQSFSALVMGTGDPAQTVIWALSGNNSSGTTISDTGLLTVAAGETATSLTVTATSTVDTSKYGTATVTVTGGGAGAGGTLTITGLPAGGTRAVYVFNSGTDISSYSAIISAYASQNYQALGASPSSDGSFTLYGWNGSSQVGSFSASESFPVLLLNSAGSATDSTNPMYAWATVSFSNGGATVSYSGFSAVVSGGTATVATVTVSPATARVVKGGTESFSATVTGTGSPAQTVTWAVTGGITGTTISAAGVLSVAANETATSLTVTATSTVDTGKYGTATVTVFALSEVGYRDMVQAVSSSVTITGNAVYGGAFPAGRTVSLSPFTIAKFETTYELWYAVYQWATSNGYTFANPGREGKNGTDGAAPTAANYEPVTYINWRDAIVWCNAYSEISGKQPVYYYNSVVIQDSTNANACDNAVMDTTKNGYRLPTEAEWEYTARGGGTPSTTGSFVYTYAGSNTIGAVAWYTSNSGYSTHPVGQKTANGLGLYDMSGNVWEWCWDWYGSVGTESVTDPQGSASGTFRVDRGGGWGSSASGCAVAFRDSNTPDSRFYDIGFRVVCP